MVEMLGVLAIIGVLSIGAFAGYQKAMMKYKLNKLSVAANQLINNALQVKDKLAYNKNTSTQYNELFQKLGLLPDGIDYNPKTKLLYERNFNNTINIYYNNVSGTSSAGDHFQNNFGGIQFKFDASANGAAVCRHIVTAAKENSANLWLVETYKYYNDTTSSTVHGIIYGDQYCQASCLRDLTLARIDALCNICDEKDCGLFVLYK